MLAFRGCRCPILPRKKSRVTCLCFRPSSTLAAVPPPPETRVPLRPVLRLAPPSRHEHILQLLARLLSQLRVHIHRRRHLQEYEADHLAAVASASGQPGKQPDSW